MKNCNIYKILSKKRKNIHKNNCYRSIYNEIIKYINICLVNFKKKIINIWKNREYLFMQEISGYEVLYESFYTMVQKNNLNLNDQPLLTLSLDDFINFK